MSRKISVNRAIKDAGLMVREIAFLIRCKEEDSCKYQIQGDSRVHGPINALRGLSLTDLRKMLKASERLLGFLGQ